MIRWLQKLFRWSPEDPPTAELPRCRRQHHVVECRLRGASIWHPWQDYDTHTEAEIECQKQVATGIWEWRVSCSQDFEPRLKWTPKDE